MLMKLEHSMTDQKMVVYQDLFDYSLLVAVLNYPLGDLLDNTY